VSAVFVANDQMALGLLRAFREAGVDVPGQVSVAGFDDIPEAEFFSPPLTTVRQDFAEVGRRSIAVLLDQIDGRQVDTPRVVVPAELVVRASTARIG
jgi:DNA-binding LacI/PurR family transcriptional regulator